MNVKELIKIVDEYYPKETALNDPSLKSLGLYDKLSKKCLTAYNDQTQWRKLVTDCRKNLNLEITEFVLLPELNSSFIAVFLTEEYTRPRPKGYEPCQLVLKISVIAPVYFLYFDNFVSRENQRLIRSNPFTEKEYLAFEYIKKNMTSYYPGYLFLDFSNAFYMLGHLGNLSVSNERKPFLDECVFGLYIGIHSHKYSEDKL